MNLVLCPAVTGTFNYSVLSVRMTLSRQVSELQRFFSLSLFYDTMFAVDFVNFRDLFSDLGILSYNPLSCPIMPVISCEDLPLLPVRIPRNSKDPQG